MGCHWYFSQLSEFISCISKVTMSLVLNNIPGLCGFYRVSYSSNRDLTPGSQGQRWRAIFPLFVTKQNLFGPPEWMSFITEDPTQEATCSGNTYRLSSGATATATSLNISHLSPVISSSGPDKREKISKHRFSNETCSEMCKKQVFCLLIIRSVQLFLFFLDWKNGDWL